MPEQTVDVLEIRHVGSVDHAILRAISQENGAFFDTLKSDFSSDKLRSAVDFRMRKYRDRLAEEYKVRKNSEIEGIFTNVVDNIAGHLLSIDPENIAIESVKELHALLFPKGLYGITLAPNGQRYYKNYPTGAYREEVDFYLVGDERVYYTDPASISEAMNELHAWMNSKSESIHPVVKIVCYYIFLCEIHPFYNGNGTVALLISEYLLQRRGYSINIVAFLRNLSFEEQRIFFKSGISGKIRDSFNLFFQKISLSGNV